MIRRATYDPFAQEHRCWPHVVHVRDRLGNIVAERKVPAWSDLRAEFEAELRRWAADGWVLEKPFQAACFMSRAGGRCVVTLAKDRSYGGGPVRS